MTLRYVFSLVCLVCVIGGAWDTEAATGTGDSPLFSLNSRFVSAVGDQDGLPRIDRLGSSYPNPFNPLTTIHFELAHPTSVDLRIFDMRGRLVRVLIANEPVEAGDHEADWDGRDSRGASVAAGVYLYQLVTDKFFGSRRMTLVK